jgi:hypothetical protein
MTDLTERHVHVDGDSWDITESLAQRLWALLPSR